MPGHCSSETSNVLSSVGSSCMLPDSSLPLHLHTPAPARVPVFSQTSTVAPTLLLLYFPFLSLVWFPAARAPESPTMMLLSSLGLPSPTSERHSHRHIQPAALVPTGLGCLTTSLDKPFSSSAGFLWSLPWVHPGSVAFGLHFPRLSLFLRNNIHLNSSLTRLERVSGP